MNWLLDLTPDEWNAVRLSIKVATVAMIASLPPGILIALLLARGRFWGKTLLNGLVHLPLILPPVVTGYLLLLTFGKRGPAGAFLAEHFGIVFSFRWTGAALACGVMGFPLMVRAKGCRSRRSTAGWRRRRARWAPIQPGFSPPSRCR